MDRLQIFCLAVNGGVLAGILWLLAAGAGFVPKIPAMRVLTIVSLY